MTFREAVGKWPAWKAASVLILILVFLFAAIEEMFISRIFHVFDYTITHFEKTFKEESREIDDDYRRFNEAREYDEAESDLNRFEIEDHHITPHQDYICGYLIINKKLKRFYDLSYVKHSEVSRKYISDRIAKNEKIIKEATDKGEFDPSKCREG